MFFQWQTIEGRPGKYSLITGKWAVEKQKRPKVPMEYGFFNVQQDNTEKHVKLWFNILCEQLSRQS